MENSLQESPGRLIRSAGEKFSKAQVALQSIDPNIIGARGAVEYVIALTDAGRDDLLRAIGREPGRDAAGEQETDQTVSGGHVNETATGSDGLLNPVRAGLPSQVGTLVDHEALPGVVQAAHGSPSDGWQFRA